MRLQSLGIIIDITTSALGNHLFGQNKNMVVRIAKLQIDSCIRR